MDIILRTGGLRILRRAWPRRRGAVVTGSWAVSGCESEIDCGSVKSRVDYVRSRTNREHKASESQNLDGWCSGESIIKEL